MGIRHLVQGEPDPRWLGRPDVRRGLRTVADAGLVYDLLTLPHQLPAAIDTVRALPGRPPSGGRKAADLCAQLLAAEPHATAERKRELRTEAARKARQSPLFFDLTLSLSNPILLFHASLGENARLARQAGDRDGDAYWSGLVGEVDEMIWQAVHAGFGYFQREAGYTRTCCLTPTGSRPCRPGWTPATWPAWLRRHPPGRAAAAARGIRRRDRGRADRECLGQCQPRNQVTAPGCRWPGSASRCGWTACSPASCPAAPWRAPLPAPSRTKHGPGCAGHAAEQPSRRGCPAADGDAAGAGAQGDHDRRAEDPGRADARPQDR